MIHSEQFEPMTGRRYELLHDNNGNGLHVYLYDSMKAVVYPNLFDFVCNVVHGDTEIEMFEVEHIGMVHNAIDKLDTYDYFAIKKEIQSVKATTDLEKLLLYRINAIKDNIDNILLAVKSDVITESILKYTKTPSGLNFITHLNNIDTASDLNNSLTT